MKNFLHATFKNKYLPFAYIASGVLAGVLGTYIMLMNVHPPENFTEVRLNTSQYHFTNPLLFYKSDADPRYEQLKNSLSSYINTAKRSGKAKDISVYFRDMNTGEWTGINEAQTYEPASMLKVTAMIAYYKRAAENPAILSRQIYYTPTSRAEETYRAQDRLAAGYYSVSELIDYMIRYSDNDALSSLASVDDNHTAEVFKLFELPIPSSSSTTDYMSARSYSRIFRVLYDSTYLPWDLSEKALQLLSTTDFKVGLVAGVPEGTLVSHKFGERTILSTDGTPPVRELHDCGIVYKAEKPYFLCVMTSGTDFKDLQAIIAEISQLTYTQV